MTKLFLPFPFLVACAQLSFAQQVVVPKYNDQYCKYVQQLEDGKTDINYREFRESFIESKQFIKAGARSSEFDSLKKIMYEDMDNKKYKDIIVITKQMLSIDYTSMIAHKILQQTYKILGDTVNRNKYHDIEFGLLNSIVKNGDGKTCATAWPVIQISEEYFILNMVGAHLKQQTLVTKDGICDKMETTSDEGEKTYYFDVRKVFEGYKKHGLE